MTEYQIELYEKNGSKLDSTLLANTNTIEKAAVKAAQELEKVEFVVGYKVVWNAKIKNPKDPKGKFYEILREGEWLIDIKTGKQLDSLEERLNQDQ